MRETIPDDVLRRADEVVLVDLTPEALLARLRAGKIYPAERIEPALQNFFQIEKLAALREVALRQAADEVELKRLPPRRSRAPAKGRLSATAAPAGGRASACLALVRPTPRAQRLVRRAWRSSRRLGAELDLLYVHPSRLPAGRRGSRAARGPGKLASVLGAHLLVEEGDDIVQVAKRVAEERGTTYVLIGPSGGGRGPLGRLRDPLPMRLLEALPGVDLRVVADRTLRNGNERR